MYHGKKEWSVDINFKKFFDLKNRDELERFIPNFQYIIFDLSQKTEEEIKGESNLEVMLFTLRCLLGEDFEKDLEEVFESVGR